MLFQTHTHRHTQTLTLTHTHTQSPQLLPAVAPWHGIRVPPSKPAAGAMTLGPTSGP